MAIAEMNLEEVLQTIDKLRPEELELVEQQLAKAKATNGISTTPKTLLEDERFIFSFDEYQALSSEELQKLQDLAYEEYRDWMYGEMAKRHARWMIICGGVVFDSSPKLKDYPSDERLDDIGKRVGFAPFIFVANPIIEESQWTAMDGGQRTTKILAPIA